MTSAARDETIAAIATPPGAGAVAIIRISGSHAFEIGRSLTGVARFEPRRARTVRIRDASGATIDHALALPFAGPASFTGEDVVELQLHGSPAIAGATLAAALAAGARLATPGEFTRRAYLAGKLDLLAAEAVADAVAAEDRSAARSAVARLSGGLARDVERLRAELEAALQELIAALDFPDEVPAPSGEALERRLTAADAALATLARDAERGRVVREGVSIAIVGPPNAGKSTLLNGLLGTDRALVSPVAGTTRDTIEERVALGSVAARIVDTAGLRPAADALEAAGIARSRRELETARLALVVVDASDAGAAADPVLGLTRERSRVVVFNKADRGRAGFDRRAEAESGALLLSALEPAGIERVRAALLALATAEGPIDLERPFLATARQLDEVHAARRALAFARAPLRAGDPIDLVAPELALAVAALGRLTGRDATEATIDAVFARFCIGK